MVTDRGASAATTSWSREAFMTLVLGLEAFTAPRRVLCLGDCPPEIVGIASLHGPVDVVDPDVTRSTSTSLAAPGARLLRAPLADAIPRLFPAYDVVLSADPEDVAGVWTWQETFEVIRRIAAPAPTSICVVDLPHHAGRTPAPSPVVPGAAPRDLAELQALWGSDTVPAIDISGTAPAGPPGPSTSVVPVALTPVTAGQATNSPSHNQGS